MYLNPIYILNKYASDLYTKEDMTNIVILVDKAVNAFVQEKGVQPSQIPTDDDGYATTSSVIECAQYKTYELLFSSYTGVNGEINDMYRQFAIDAKIDLDKLSGKVTKNSILRSTNLRREDSSSSCPVE